MERYLGLRLRVYLKDGSEVTGVVAGLDPTAASMTLHSVTLRNSDQTTREIPLFSVYGHQITDLTVCEFPQLPTMTPPQQSVPMPQSNPLQNIIQTGQSASSSIDQISAIDHTPISVANPSAAAAVRSNFVDPAIISMTLPSTSTVQPTKSEPSKEKEDKPVVNNKPDESSTSNTQHSRAKVNGTEPPSTAKTTSSTAKNLLFGLSTAPKKTIVGTECVNYEDFVESYGRPSKSPASYKIQKQQASRSTEQKTPKSIEPKPVKIAQQKIPKPAEQKPAKTNEPKTVKIVERPKQAKAPQPVALPENAVTTLGKPDEPVLNQEATQSLVSMLKLSPPAKVASNDNTAERKGSQSSIKIPANLIPPKARNRLPSNGSISVPSTAATNKPEIPSQPVISPNHFPPTGSSGSVQNETNRRDQETALETNGNVDFEDDGLPVIKTVSNGARCPVVTLDQMRRVEELCESETGPTRQMIVENAGYGASIMALKAIGGNKRIQHDNHNGAPVIVVLAGNNKVGSYSLAAARHLANRSCHVYVLLASRKEALLDPVVATQKKCAEYSGARFVDSVDELPQQLTTPVDLIIDALMGSETSLSKLRGDYATRQMLWDAMDWANSNKAPVLSLDFPSGINATDGHPFHVMHHIQPKWTLCFGAPKQGCTSRAITGELFLADIGIPSVSWRNAGVKRCNIAWGAEFVLALEYGETPKAE